MKRRILSSLMALVLVFGLLPATAFAEGETPDAELEVTAVETPSAEGRETQLAAPKVKIDDTLYGTLDQALKAAQDGATIQLGEGNYATYIAKDQPNYSGKNLTFEGKGNQTVWQIGAKNPNPDLLGTEYNGDYSFDGRGTAKEETVTFKNINFYVGTENYLGFIGIDNFVLENCTVNGIMTYGGTKTAKYKGVVFNAPTYAKNKKIDYSFYSIDGDVVTFKDCTFNGEGKFINVYTHYEEDDVTKTINFDSCTVNSTGNNKQPLNIKNGDSTRDTKRTVNWTINISGKNTFTSETTVENQPVNATTCSRWFSVQKDSSNPERDKLVTVNIDGETVWQDGKMVSHAIDTTNDKYTDGYKDNAFTITPLGEWKNNGDGTESREVTKTCNYCGYETKDKETQNIPPIDWDVSKSKTATQLNTNTWTSDVTLSLLNTKEALAAGKDSIGAGSTVTDTIGKKFDFDGIKSLTVGGKQLTMVNDDKDKNTWYFGNDKTVSAADCRFKVVYDSAKDAFVWTINEKVTQSEPVQLTYTVRLLKPETEPGIYGTTDLKGEKTLSAADALFTNESAVLNAKNSAGAPVKEQVFPKPSVSYTISSGTGGDDGDDDKYFFAIQKVDAQDGHALNGATFELYQLDKNGKVDNRSVTKTRQQSSKNGIALFSVDNKDSYDGIWYYAEVTAPEGYVLDSTEHKIKAKDFSDSLSTAVSDAGTVRNYRGTTPDLLNDSDHFAYVIGYMDGNVRPYGLISRAETTTIFFRLLKDSVRDGNLLTSNTYTDVADDYWANTAISTMTGLGIVQGRSTTTFDPKAPITRAQFAAICARFDTGKSNGEQTFSDIQGHWAEKYIQRAAELGWIKGFEDGTFRPDTYITRAQAMTMINRVLNRIPEDESDLLPGMNVWPDCNPGDWFYLAVQEATNSHDFEHKAGNYETWTGMNKDPDWTRYEH